MKKRVLAEFNQSQVSKLNQYSNPNLFNENL